MNGSIDMGCQFLWVSLRIKFVNFGTHEIAMFCMYYMYKENCYSHKFWTPKMCNFCSINDKWYP